MGLLGTMQNQTSATRYCFIFPLVNQESITGRQESTRENVHCVAAEKPPPQKTQKVG